MTVGRLEAPGLTSLTLPLTCQRFHLGIRVRPESGQMPTFGAAAGKPTPHVEFLGPSGPPTSFPVDQIHI